MSIKADNTVGVILAGGAGRRMAGADKGLQLYQGKPMIEWVISRLRSQVASLLICANRNQEQYRRFGHCVIQDTEHGFQGPLAGIVAAVRHLHQQPDVTALLVCSCDTPNVPNELFERLRINLESAQKVAVANDGSRPQHLHCLIPRPVWSSLLSYYEGGGRAAHRWQQNAGMIEVDFSDQAGDFLNINRLDQLQSTPDNNVA